MAKNKKPTDCKFYPFCERLKELVGDIPTDLVLARMLVLLGKAELICAQCRDFEPRPALR